MSPIQGGSHLFFNAVTKMSVKKNTSSSPALKVKNTADLAGVKKFTRKGWYVGGKRGSGFPAGVACSLCRRITKEDEVIYAFQVDTSYNTKKVVVQHKECMESVLIKSPCTKFEQIKQRLLDGGNFFE